jgi:tetratricopeptide (TPR) repeat protein
MSLETNRIALIKNNQESEQEERILRRCRLAQELEDKGHYEEARQALGNQFPKIGVYPNFDALSAFTQAELLVRIGAISGWIGSEKGIDGAQEYAQDLISQAARIFAAGEAVEKEADALIDLAICYWRIGAYDEARTVLDDLLEKIGGRGLEQEGRALLQCAIVEIKASRFHEALEALAAAAPFYEASSNPAAKGRFHMNLAICYRNLGELEKRQDYIDRALIENAGASRYLQEAGHTRHAARVENNLGYLLYRIGRYGEAHQHLEHACRMFIDLKDSISVAQVNDSRAQVYLAQGQYAEAETVSFGAVHALEHGGQQALLGESLITYGTALARMGQEAQARKALDRAAEVAAQVGDIEAAGRAHLVFLEELSANLSTEEMVERYLSADRLLENSKNAETLSRLRASSRRLITALSDMTDKNSSFDDVMMEGTLYDELARYEGELVRRAWEHSGGRLTRTAKILGISHQGLRFILDGRLKDRIPGITPPRPRRRSIMGTAGRRTKRSKK